MAGMAFCARCGGELPATARFCPACGRPVDPEVGPPAPPPVPPILAGFRLPTWVTGDWQPHTANRLTPESDEAGGVALVVGPA